ncbi:MAG: alpha-2-macroglobulin, partial [Methanosarcinales archaeon]|nr:alpha-2-macroglobulin [Methanosarcinales archaeon]
MNSKKMIPIAVILLSLVLLSIIAFPKISPAIKELSNQPANPFSPSSSYKGCDLLILAPQVMFTNGESAITIAAEHKGQPVEQSISFMLTDAKGVKTELTKCSTGNEGHVVATFDVPDIEQGTYILVAQPAGSDTEFKGSVRIANSSALFLETDKPIYKPGQTIHGRVLSLNNKMIPIQGECIIEISDAKGIKIFKETLSTNEYGVASFDMPLANELNLGTWKATASMGESTTQLDLRIEKYVLPKFEVNVSTPKDWFLVDEKITGKVDAAYFFGKPVEGQVTITASRYVGIWEEYATYDADLEEGSIEFDLPEAGYVSGTHGAGGMGSLMLNISVTDTGDHTETTTTLLKIADSSTVLQLIPESSLVKPGMPFNILIVTETPDGEPLDKEVEVEIEIDFIDEDYNSNTETKTVNTANGVALVTFQVPDDTRNAYINAECEQTRQNMELGAVYSPSASFLHIVQTSEGIPHVGDTIAFEVFSTNPGTVYYDIVSCGRTVFSATSDQRNISLVVTPQMSPQAEIVAYIINPNSEVSVDTLPFNVVLETPVDLQVSFDQEQVLPGGDVGIDFNVQSRSMIGYSIVDESVYALSEGRLNLQQVFNELEIRFMEPQVEAHPQRVYALGASDIIKDAGLQILTSPGIEVPKTERQEDGWLGNGIPKGGLREGMIIENVAMDDAAVDVAEAIPTAAEEEGTLAQVGHVRQFFPETWI